MSNINKDPGFTLTELIMIIVIIAIIALTTSAIIIFFMRNTIFLPSQMNVQQAADAAMDIMIEGDDKAKGLRFAREILALGNNMVQFRDTDGQQEIRYRRRNDRLQRRIREVGGSWGSWEIIPYYATGNLRVTRQPGGIFEFFDENEGSTSDPADVRRIKINLRALSGTGDIANLEGEIKLTSSVKLYKFNQPPVVTIVSVTEQTRKNRWRIRFRVEDPDGGNVSWNASLSPGNAGTLSNTSGSGNVTYTRRIYYYPAAGFSGTATIIISVNDGDGGTDSASVPIEVVAPNQDPVIRNIWVNEQPGRYSITFRVEDPDGGSVKWYASLSPGNAGTLSSTSGSGNVTYTRSIYYYPAAGFSGTATIYIKVNDGDGGTDSASVPIEVVAPNQDPVIKIVRVRELPGLYSITFRVEDPDGGNVSWNASLSPGNAGTLSSTSGSGNVTYTRSIYYYPAAGFSGTARIYIKVNDGDGGTDSASVNIRVP